VTKKNTLLLPKLSHSSESLKSAIQACIVYQLASGSVVYRAPVRHLARRKGSKCFLPQVHFRKLLRNHFGEDGLAMCCQVDQCNFSVDPGFAQMHQKSSSTHGPYGSFGIFQYPPATVDASPQDYSADHGCGETLGKLSSLASSGSAEPLYRNRQLQELLLIFITFLIDELHGIQFI